VFDGHIGCERTAKFISLIQGFAGFERDSGGLNLEAAMAMESPKGAVS